MKDKLVWKTEKNGKFFECSAYCVDNIVDNFHLHRLGRWNLFWKLKAPSKIKNLVWWFCRGCFPTRYVSCQTDCVVCSANNEDSIQVLLECPRIIQVWCVTHLWDTIDKVLWEDHNMGTIIFNLLQELPTSQRKKNYFYLMEYLEKQELEASTTDW